MKGRGVVRVVCRASGQVIIGHCRHETQGLVWPRIVGWAVEPVGIGKYPTYRKNTKNPLVRQADVGYSVGTEVVWCAQGASFGLGPHAPWGATPGHGWWEEKQT